MLSGSWNISQAPQTNPSLALLQQNITPYQDQNFLNSVFNFNPDYIQAFVSLPHELKLKFYISVQEMKFLHYMNDRDGYQKILQQINRRMLIIKKPSHTNAENKNQGPKKDWGQKLQNLCEGHLKKIRDKEMNEKHEDEFGEFSEVIQKNGNAGSYMVDDLWGVSFSHKSNNYQRQQNIQEIGNKQIFDFQNSQTIPNSKKQSSKQQKKSQQQQQQQFEWSQPPKQQPSLVSSLVQSLWEPSTKPAPQIQNANSLTEAPPLHVHFGEQKHLQKAQSMNVPFQSFSSSMKNVQPKTQQHIDVWDLQIIQEDPNKIRDIIRSQTHLENSNTIVQEKEKSDKSKQASETDNSEVIKHEQNVQTNLLNQQPVFVSQNKIQNTYNNFQLDFFTEPKTQKQQQKIQNNEQQFEWETQAPQKQPHSQPHISSDQPSEPKIIQPKISIQQQNQHEHEQQHSHQNGGQNNLMQNFLSPPQNSHMNHSRLDKSHSHTNSSGRNYDTQPQIQHQNSNNSNGTNNMQTSFAFDLKVFETGYSLATVPIQNDLFSSTNKQNSNNNNNTNYLNFNLNLNESEQQQQPSLNISSALLSPSINIQLLSPLKCKAPTQNLVSSLRKKVFDCDRTFYQQALALIQQLGFSSTPDYSYIKQQSKICDRIFQLTETYTTAVEQQQQQKIKQNLSECKRLYSQLDTSRTVATVRKYLKMEGEGLEYRLAKLVLEAGVPKQLLQKSILSKQKDKNKFTDVVTLLYLLVYFGTVHTLSNFVSQAVQYFQHIYTEMQTILQQSNTLPDEAKKLLRAHPSFVQYQQNISAIASKTKRMVTLSTISTRQQPCYQTATLMQKFSSFPPQHNSPQQIVPNYFSTFLSAFASQNNLNLYILHSQMRQFLQEHPLCCICLQVLEEGGAKREDGHCYHFQCFNWKREISKWKDGQMATSYM